MKGDPAASGADADSHEMRGWAALCVSARRAEDDVRLSVVIVYIERRS
jgi:hypothetical protein